MLIDITRITQGTTARLSLLAIAGVDCCFVLEENPDRFIPAGEYQVFLQNDTEPAAVYNRIFHKLGHDGLLTLGAGKAPVTYLGIGVSSTDTDWCLGTGLSVSMIKRLILGSAVDAYKRVYPVIREALRVEHVSVVVHSPVGFKWKGCVSGRS